MSVVNLEIFKKHCNADDFDDDDDYMQHLLDAAEGHVVRATGRSMEELTEMGGGRFPTELSHAVLLLGAHWYNQRESVSGVQMHGVPQSFDALLKPFRRLV